MANKIRKEDMVEIVAPVSMDSPLVESVASIPDAAERAQVMSEVKDVVEAMVVSRTTCREAYTSLKTSTEKMQKYVDSLTSLSDAQKKIITGLVDAIDTAARIKFKAKLDESSLNKLSAAHAQMVDKEVELFDAQMNKQKDLVKDYTQEIADMIKAGKGVWIPSKIFWCLIIILFTLALYWGITCYANMEVIHSEKLSYLWWASVFLMALEVITTVYIFWCNKNN